MWTAWTPGLTARVCSEHFSLDAYDLSNPWLRHRLKPNAVPTIFDFPQHLQPKVCFKAILIIQSFDLWTHLEKAALKLLSESALVPAWLTPSTTSKLPFLNFSINYWTLTVKFRHVPIMHSSIISTNQLFIHSFEPVTSCTMTLVMIFCLNQYIQPI